LALALLKGFLSGFPGFSPLKKKKTKQKKNKKKTELYSNFQFVYVIGLHAVQFGNNWMKKILRTAKIGLCLRHRPIWQSEEFFESNYFQIGQAFGPITY